MARYLLRDGVQKKFGDKLVKINEGMEKEGGFYLFSLRLVPIFPFFIINLVMGLISTFQIFAQAYIMTRGGPDDATLFYAYGLFNNAFRYMKMGYASAMAWVLFAIILVLTVVQLRVSRLWVHYETEN